MAFVPSSNFYTPVSEPQPLPSSSALISKRKRLFIPPSNTIVEPPATVPTSVETPDCPSAPEIAPEPEEIKVDDLGLSLSPDEMDAPLLQKTLAGNFAHFEIKKKPQAPLRPKKNVENFVKLNLKKGRSFAKMGKCRGANYAHRRTKWGRRGGELDELPLRCFSKGYYEDRQRRERSLDELLREEFGFQEWEPQQRESIESILAGSSTLVVLPTGAGKSLIYQMCARVLGGLTVVVFPLVSLIADQLDRTPACLSAGSMHSSQPFTDTLAVIKAARAGKLDLLLTTPEKLSFFLALPLTSVRLVCVDEAHCISEWSHAFRAAYYDILLFMRRHALSLTLSLTATATARTVADISEKLSVGRVVHSGGRLRGNIRVTCSRDVDVISAASDMVLSKGTKDGGILVFAAYQSQAQSLCDWLRGQGVKAKCYHGKLTENEKYQIQNSFNSGETRVLATTLAFGMGIDKADIRGVIHLSFPKSIEQFIQESGRAGRDGKESWAHVIVQKSQYYVIQAYTIAEHVTPKLVQTLIRSIAPPHDSDKQPKANMGGSEPLPFACVAVQETCDLLGLEKDTIRMLLALLEKKGYLTYISTSFLHGVVQFHKRPAEEVAQTYAAVSHILAVGKSCGGRWHFSVPLIAQRLGVPPPDLVQVLKRLECTRDITLELTKEAFCFSLNVGVSDDDLGRVSGEIAAICEEIETVEIYKLQNSYQMLHANSAQSHSGAQDVREAVKTFVDEYYEEDAGKLWPGVPIFEDVFDDCSQVVGDFEGPPDEKDVTCVLMGVRSKKVYPDLWRSHACWGKYSECNFFEVLRHAQLFLSNQLKPKETSKRLKTS